MCSRRCDGRGTGVADAMGVGARSDLAEHRQVQGPLGRVASARGSCRDDAGCNVAGVGEGKSSTGRKLNMPPLARRNLFHDKVRLTVTLTGIVFAVVLIVVQLGLFLGFTTATSNLIDHSNADLWITSKNVPYVEQGVAFSERKLNQVRAVEGVGDAQKIIAKWTQWKRHDGGQESVQIVGINVDDSLERPWNLVEGRVEDLKSPDAVILDEL